MNKFFKVKWNVACRRYDVTSELARGKIKSAASGKTSLRGSVKAIIFSVSGLMGMPGAVLADEITLDSFRPDDGGHIQVVSGPSDTLKANNWSAIVRGAEGYIFTTFSDARDRGLINGSGLNYLDQQVRTGTLKGFDYFDQETGTIRSFEAFDNANIQLYDGLNQVVPISYAVGVDGQYVDRNLVEVSPASELTVEVGNSASADWINDPLNTLQAIMKGSETNPNFISSVFKASSSNVAMPATINYASKTVAFLGNNSNVARPENSPYTSFKAGFSGEFTSAIGIKTVNSIDELKSYNQMLIDAIKDGVLDSKKYNSEFNKAFNQTWKYIYIDYANNPIPQDDAVWQDVNSRRVAFLLGEGTGATINIRANASILAQYSDASVVRVDNGATLNNDGELDSFSNTARGAMTVYATNGSVVNNNGIIGAGSGAWQKLGAGGANNAIRAESSTLNNNGIINIGPRGVLGGNMGVTLQGNSTLTNAGNINAITLEEPGMAANTSIFTRGVLVDNNSVFNNSGQVYMGRQAQRTFTDTVSDVAVSTSGNRLVDVRQSGSFHNNAGGEVVLGSLVQGAVAVYAGGALTRTLNDGVISLYGKARGANGEAPLQNVGMLAAEGATDVVNGASGLITLKGVNSVAMKALSAMTDRMDSSVRNDGTIDVETGVDPVTKTANYGLWAEGLMASATNAGTINLEGERAIAAHARNGGQLVINDGAAVNFIDKNQIGYYVFGSGSGITDNSSTRQSVSTDGSVLYRIDGGAAFDGTGTGTQVGVDGQSATGLLVTGSSGAGSTLNTGNMTLDVTGSDATGIRVAGSASGILSADTTLNLSGAGSSAGIVDGNYTDITGSTSFAGGAVLTSHATLTSANAAAGAIGYIASNGGMLDHQGTIDFTAADTTGVKVDGGELSNSGSIRVNGTAVDIEGADSVVNNSGTVEATDGTAAFRVGSGADLSLNGSGVVRAGSSAHGVLLDSGATGLIVEGATIDMAAGGSGSAIENAAELKGIQLKNTTINVGDGTGVRTAATLADTNSGTINVEGSGTGIYFGHADGSATAGTLDTSGSRDLVINVNDAAGKGIVTNTSGDVKSGASVNVNDAAGDAALIVGGTTSKVEQSGVLTSRSLTSAVIDVDNGRLTSFINRGDIIANSAAQEAIKVTLGSNIDFTNATGGNIVGRVDLSDGNNRVTLEGGSTATDILTGSGDDSYYLNNISADEAGLFTSLQAGSGSDTLNLNNSSLTVTDPAMLTGFEKISLSQASLLNLSSTLLPLGDTQNDGTGTGFTLHDSSTLKLSGTADTAFASHIAGTGTLATDLAGQAFDFTSNNAANTFTGTLALGNATFDLAGENTQALTTATLRADNGGIVTVGTGSQAIGGLAFDGGTVKFNTGTPGRLDITTTVAAQQMDLSGHGTVEISAGTVDNNPVLPPDRLSVLEQDDSGIEMQLASSATPVIADGGNLRLKDQFGNIITDALTREVEQNGVQVANATYDYRLTSGGSSDGLYVNYGLTQLDLQGKNSNALSLNAAGKSGNAADLSARITGNGDLAVDGGNVSLSNMDNDYLGKTFIRSGSLSMMNDNVLGKTSELAMIAGTGFAMNGHGQTVGAVNTAAGSLIDLDGGDLTVNNGGTLDGDITGAGTLNLVAGLLNVHGANGSLTAVTNIASGAQALLNNAAGLGQGGIVTDGILGITQATGNLVNTLSGSGDVAIHDGSNIVLTGNNGDFAGRFVLDNGTSLSVTAADSLGTATVSNEGTLNILTSADWTLTNSVSGSGSLNKNGGGIMTLTQDAASYTGTTAVNSGGLMLGTAGSAVTLASSQTDVAKDALFGGFGGTAGSLNNAGTFIVGDLTTPATRALPVASTFTVGGGLNNSGYIRVGQVGSGIVGNNLNVAGDYHGDNGRIHFNTALGGDNSLTDHMTVNGNTSGTTAVSVSNAGGLGGKTINGIELIAVRGASEGEFTQDGRIVAGAYDYMLARGKGENAANWYLTSGQEGGGGGDEGPGPEKEKIVLITRPESGAYASNMAAANTLFNTRMQDRLGETHYVDALTGEQKVTSMWLRNVGGHTRSTDSTGQLHTQANRWVTQLGGDVAQWSSDGADRFHLGVMAGYANQHSSTRNNVSGHSAKGSIDGYSTGIYATWLQDNEEKTGAYVDSWTQYSWFNNTVAGDTLNTESYKSDGITASVEAGYTWKLGEKNVRESYYIQPKAQVTWMGVEMDNVNESNGTRVSGSGDGNIQTRLGVRAFIKGHNKVDEGKQRTFEPFVEANWIANTKNFGSSLNGVNVSQRGTKNIGELKVGVEGQINPNLNLWGNIGQQMGDKGYSDSSAMLGVKVNF